MNLKIIHEQYSYVEHDENDICYDERSDPESVKNDVCS